MTPFVAAVLLQLICVGADETQLTILGETAGNTKPKWAITFTFNVAFTENGKISDKRKPSAGAAVVGAYSSKDIRRALRAAFPKGIPPNTAIQLGKHFKAGYLVVIEDPKITEDEIDLKTLAPGAVAATAMTATFKFSVYKIEDTSCTVSAAAGKVGGLDFAFGSKAIDVIHDATATLSLARDTGGGAYYRAYYSIVGAQGLRNWGDEAGRTS